jgi:Mn-dependent transcriptional regulator
VREQTVKEYLCTIYMLASFGAVRASYIAREMLVSRPSVSVALKALEKDGYLSVDCDHLIRLTEAGKKKAEESICEKIDRGNNFSLIAEQIQGGTALSLADIELRREDQLLRLLAKDQSAGILEAILILSGRYYCVRIIDISQFLGRSSASVRAALTRLEKYGLASRGEETTVTLTEEGKTLAGRLYKEHEETQNEMMKNGLDSFEAEQKSLST